MSEHDDSYPRQSARTQRFTLGEPRDVVVSPDGQRIVFLRSRGGTDPVNCLWVVDAATGDERLVADPGGAARRARRRPAAGGAGAARAGQGDRRRDHRLRHRRRRHGHRLRHRRPAVRRRAAQRPGARAPRRRPGVRPPSRSRCAQRVAYVSGRLLCIAELDGRWRVLAGGEDDEPETVTWGSADFVAAEEMDRLRGFWWSPDGTAPGRVPGRHRARAAVAPRRPRRSGRSRHASCRTRPRGHRTPTSRCTSSASTARSSTSSGTATRSRTSPTCSGAEAGLIASVLSRDQRALDVVRVDPATGATEALFEDRDDVWVELVPGVPRLTRRRARSSRVPTVTAPAACSSTASR